MAVRRMKAVGAIDGSVDAGILGAAVDGFLLDVSRQQVFQRAAEVARIGPRLGQQAGIDGDVDRPLGAWRS